MAVNKFSLDEYKRIRNGFRLEVLSQDIPTGDEFKQIREFVIERKFNTLLDLISYIHSLKGYLWIRIANSNNRKTLFGGFASYFIGQTVNYDEVTK